MAHVEITVKASHVITPTEKTWTGTMQLSEIDMAMGKGFVPKLYIYRAHIEWAPPAMSRTVKDSLAKALVQFYPFAGRLRPKEGGRSELVVDDSDAATWGVPLVEAEADVELTGLGDLAEAEADGRLACLFAVPDYGKRLEEMALLTVKITCFRCGGVAVAFTWSHVVVDGFGAGRFYSHWTRIARGEPLGMAPNHDRSVLRAGEHPRSIPEFIQLDESSKVDIEQLPLLPTRVVKFSVSKSQVNKLKQIAGQANSRPHTRFEVLAAHIWRCVSKARGDDGKKLNSMGIVMDIHKRVNPPLPPTFTGNAVIILTATSKTEDLVSNSLGYACSIIRQTVNKLTNDLVWAFLDYQKSVDDLGVWRGVMTPEGYFMNPDVMMVSWMNLGFNGLDFGWGNEAHMTSDPQVLEGVSCLLDGREEGSAIVVMCLQVDHVDKFRDYFFLELE